MGPKTGTNNARRSSDNFLSGGLLSTLSWLGMNPPGILTYQASRLRLDFLWAKFSTTCVDTRPCDRNSSPCGGNSCQAPLWSKNKLGVIMMMISILAELFSDPGRTRTCNPRLRRPMPYPLGHGADIPTQPLHQLWCTPPQVSSSVALRLSRGEISAPPLGPCRVCTLLVRPVQETLGTDLCGPHHHLARIRIIGHDADR